MSRGVFAVTAALGATHLCCTAPDRFDHHVDSEHIRLFYDPAEPPCEGAVHSLERIAQAQASRLGLPLPRIDYYLWPRFAEEEFAAQAPCSDALGCAIGQEIWARGLIAHELVHAIEHASRDASAVFFDEGMAVALGEPIPRALTLSAPPALTISREQLDGRRYAEAGDFVSFLLLRYGSDRVHSLMEAIPRGADSRSVADAFTDVLGMTPSQVWQARTHSGQEFEGGSLNLPACTLAEVVPWQTPNAWSLAAQLDDRECAAIAPRGFELDEPGVYRLAFRSQAGATAQFRSCEPDDHGGRLTGAASRQLVIARLSAGRYVLELSPGSHDVVMAANESTTDCGASPALVPSDFEKVVVEAARHEALSVALQFETGAELAIELAGARTSATVCAPRVPDADCHAIVGGDIVRVAAHEAICARAPPGTVIRMRQVSGDR